MDRRELVNKAINMEKPDRVPILLFNKDKEDSDIVMIDVVEFWMGKNKNISEWGFKWEKKNETMGYPKEPLIKTWEDLDRFKIPDPYDKNRFNKVKDTINKYGDKYYIASLVLTGFTVMTFIRGFSETLEDLYINRVNIERLADIVFGFEEEVIKQVNNYKFDAVAFFDDWGIQDNLMISPKLWRDFFKPRYKRQFDLCHEYGLDVYFHCCGYIYEIITDLIEIGVDMLNLSQPNLFDIKEIGKKYGGRVCFVCPISYQTTSISGNKTDIYNEARKLIENLGCYGGGFIGYVEEYHSIGLSDENYQNCINAFRDLGKYR